MPDRSFESLRQQNIPGKKRNLWQIILNCRRFYFMYESECLIAYLTNLKALRAITSSSLVGTTTILTFESAAWIGPLPLSTHVLYCWLRDRAWLRIPQGEVR